MTTQLHTVPPVAGFDIYFRNNNCSLISKSHWDDSGLIQWVVSTNSAVINNVATAFTRYVHCAETISPIDCKLSIPIERSLFPNWCYFEHNTGRMRYLSSHQWLGTILLSIQTFFSSRTMYTDDAACTPWWTGYFHNAGDNASDCKMLKIDKNLIDLDTRLCFFVDILDLFCDKIGRKAILVFLSTGSWLMKGRSGCLTCIKPDSTDLHRFWKINCFFARTC